MMQSRWYASGFGVLARELTGALGYLAGRA